MQQSPMLRLGGGFELAAESLTMGVMLFVLPLMFVGGLVQAMLAIGTDIAAPILAALMPITAAASVISPGKKAFNTQLGWWLSCLLFKLAAASIYGVGVYLIKTAGGTLGDQDSGPVVGLLSGLIVVVLAIFSLPALVRLVTPGINSVVGGNGGGRFLATAGGVAAGAVLSGLVGVGTSAASKGGGGGGVSQVPSGAQSNYSGGGAGSSTVASGGSGGGSRGAGGFPIGSSSSSSEAGGSSQGAGPEDSSPTMPIGHSGSGSDPDPGSGPASEVDQSGQSSPAGASSQDSSSAGAVSGASGKGSADGSAARTGGSGATGADRSSRAGGSSADQGSAGPTPAGAASSGRGNRSGNGARRVIETGLHDAAETIEPEGAEQ